MNKLLTVLITMVGLPSLATAHTTSEDLYGRDQSSFRNLNKPQMEIKEKMSDTRSYTEDSIADSLAKRHVAELWGLTSQEIKGLSQGTIKEIADYAFGYRATKDLERAAALYRIAALAGDRESQSQFSELLYQGLGVPQNKEQSLSFALLAAQNGDNQMLSFLLGLVQQEKLVGEFGPQAISKEQEIRLLAQRQAPE